MNIKLSVFFLIPFFLITNNLSYGQNQFREIYHLPSHLPSGSIDCNFSFDYRFAVESIGDKYQMVLFMKVKGEPWTSGGEYRYKYKGIEYSHNVLSSEDGQEMSGFTEMVEKRIQAYLSLKQSRTSYKNYINKDDMEFNSQNWPGDISNYEQALALFPNETYPKSQLDKIQKEVAKKQAPSATAPKNSTGISKEEGKTDSKTSAESSTSKDTDGNNYNSGSNGNSSENTTFNNTSHTNNSAPVYKVPTVEQDLQKFGIDPNTDYIGNTASMSFSMISEWADENRKRREKERAIKAQIAKANREKFESVISGYLESANKGDAQAMYTLSICYAYPGDPALIDLDKSIHWMDEAYKLGHPDAIYFWGATYMAGRAFNVWIHPKGPGYRVNEELGISELHKAAEKGHIKSINLLMDLYAGKKVDLNNVKKKTYKERIDTVKATYYNQLFYSIQKQDALTYRLDEKPVDPTDLIPFMGIKPADITNERIKFNGKPVTQGAYAQSVFPEYGAYEAGLRQGDVIVRLNDKEIKLAQELIDETKKYFPGDVVKITYLRGGKKITTDVILKNRNLLSTIARPGLKEFENFKKNFLDRISDMLNVPSVPWNKVVQFNGFGKTADELMKQDAKIVKNKNSELINVNGVYGIYQVIPDNKDYPIPTYDISYKVNGVFKQVQSRYLFDEDGRLIGLTLFVYNNSDYTNDKTKLEDLIKNLGDAYVKINEETILYKDKLIILNRSDIHLYDLNQLKDAVAIAWPEQYKNISSISKGKYNYLNPGMQYQIYTDSRLDPKQAAVFKEKAAKGVVISYIEPGGKAESAGIKAGDVIIQVNGTKVSSAYFLELFLHIPGSEKRYELTYLRNGMEYKTIISL